MNETNSAVIARPGDDSLVVAGGLRAMTKRNFDSNFKQQAHVHILAAGDARGLRFVSLESRGSRKCRMRAAPAVPCAKWVKKTHTSIQVQRRHSGIPCAM